MADDPEIDALFQLPLAEFIAARNQAAARLRAGGAAAEAARVKALAKPSAAAWAVNQLYWTERSTFDALIDAGNGLRAAQRAGDAPEAIREAMRRRRDCLGAAAKRAEALLAAHGHGAATATVLRIASTLEALASSEDPGSLAGRLSTDLDAPGFDALAGLTLGDPPAARLRLAPPISPPATSSPADVAGAEARARSRAAVVDAQGELRRCQEAEAEASAQSESARQRAEAAAEARDRARREAERAEFAAREAREAAAVAQRQVEAAVEARVRAEAALEAAQGAIADS